MRGAIPPLPNTPSWRGAQLKHRDKLTFTFYIKLQEACKGVGLKKDKRISVYRHKDTGENR
jgi:hypothetical protein